MDPNIVTPFKVSGSLAKPTISIQQGGGRVVAEVVTMPLSILGLLVGDGE